jgi:hypothetical protein
MNHIREHGSGGSMQGAFFRVIRCAGDLQLVVFHFDIDQSGKFPMKFTLRSLYADFGASQLHLHASWDVYR